MDNNGTDKVVSLFAGADPRCQLLCDALLDTVYERGRGMSVPAILGVLRIVEAQILEDHRDAC